MAKATVFRARKAAAARKQTGKGKIRVKTGKAAKAGGGRRAASAAGGRSSGT